jgi:cation diffusion facilitator family transporter
MPPPEHRHDRAARGAATTRAAGLSIASNLFLTSCKIGTGWWIGSAAVISEGLHSATDMLASFSAYFSVRMSSLPADEAHPYGHGKFEDIAAVFEASLIAAATLGVVAQAVKGYLAGLGPTHPEIGMGVMALSIAVNSAVSRYLFRTARDHDSVALEADAWHLSADVLTSVGVLVGLGLVWATGRVVFDPLAALGVGLWILVEAWRIGRTGLANLVDTRLPAAEVQEIEELLRSHCGRTAHFHDLRTRKAGPERHIDLHLVVPRSMPTGDAHDLCHQMEDAVRRRFPGARILVHLESEPAGLSAAPRPLRGPLDRKDGEAG